MGNCLNHTQAEELFEKLFQDYLVYAPKRFLKQGRYSDTDVVRYAQIQHWQEIVWDKKSDFPAKEVLSPIQQTIFYFTEDEYRESKVAQKPMLIFMRPCDIHAQKIQEQIYCDNGMAEDFYYKRMRERVKFVLMDCGGGDENCFCVSMGTNQTDDYAAAFCYSPEGLQVDVVDAALTPYVQNLPTAEGTPAFVTENVTKVTVPDLSSFEVRHRLKSHPMWNEFNSRCISCGSCTVACATCTCFTTRDVIYGDNPEVGERRRVSASCQIAGFDQMAGQNEFRSTAGDRMRYKMLHKFHDHQARFCGPQMCVGCGRCTSRCPELISITATLNKMAAAVQEIQIELAKGEALK